MCNPTTALVATSAVSAGLQYQTAKQQQKMNKLEQRQNEIAKAKCNTKICFRTIKN